MNAEHRLIVEVVLLAIILIAAFTGYKFYRHPLPPAEYKRVSDMVVGLSEQVSRLSVRLIDVESLLDRYEHGIYKLIEQLKRANMTPEWEPNGDLKKLKDGRAPAMRLYNAILAHFNDEELNAIAFELGTSIEDMGGDTHPTRAQALIEWAGRQNRTADLLNIVRRERPSADWPRNPA